MSILRAAATAGNGQTTFTSSLSITVPTSGAGGTVIAGDVAIITVLTSATTVTMTTPSGWTALYTGDSDGSSTFTWVLYKTLVAGDIGSSVTLSFSSSPRCLASMVVVGGATTTGLLSGHTLNTTASTSAPAPTVGSVPAGAFVLEVFAGRFAGAPAAGLTLPAGLSDAGAGAATAYTAAINNTIGAGYEVASSSGSYGGDTGTWSSSCNGATYTIALPSGQADNTQQVPSAAVGASSAAVTPSLSAPVPSAFVPVRSQDAAVIGDTTLTVPSAAVGLFTDPAAPGTAVPAPTAFVGVEADPGSLTATASPAVPSAFVPVRSQDAAVTASSTQTVPSAVVAAVEDAPGVFELYRMQVWTGSTWKKVTPLVWDGTDWVAIPVTVTPTVT